MTPTLTLSQLEYGHQSALFAPLNLHCQPGEIWAVLGANGRGKSTLLDTITGAFWQREGLRRSGDRAAVIPSGLRLAGKRGGADGACATYRPLRSAAERR